MVSFPGEKTSTSAVDSAVSSAVVADMRWPGGRFLDTPQSSEHSAAGPSETDYEGLPEGVPTSTHMLAGSVAGIMEHCLMYPVDFVKTRMQSLKPEPGARYHGVTDALRRIVRTEGVWRPVRGLNVMAAGAGPAHAMYFACYEKIKVSLNNNAVYPGANSHLTNGAAGCVATLLHDAVMNPADVVKQRMQVYNSPYRGALHCVRDVLKHEGPAAFYRSYTTQLTMNVPFQALHFVTYEYLQERLNPCRQYNPASHLVSGALAGAVAASLTMPLDVCKTLLNTQEPLGAVHVIQAPQAPSAAAGGVGAVVAAADTTTATSSSRYVSGLGQAFRTVYRTGGVPAFFKGVQARVIYHVPSTAICWSVYEFFKYAITERRKPGGV